MEHASKIETLLGSFCDEKIADAAEIDDRYRDLWQEIRQYLLTGGKRMRPRLVMLAYEAYGGKNPGSIIPIAAAWELLHACLLVHDDIIDRDLVRHGRPNIAGRYQEIYGDLGEADVDHYALSAALLSGDLLLMSTYELVQTAPLSSDEKLLVQKYLNQAIFSVAGGELIDTDSVLYDPRQTDPLLVARYKTASYSLQSPLQCGAALAGATEEELKKLAEIGLHTGIAYQLKDDVLGVFGDIETTGKSNRSDILEKKRTFLIKETLKNLAPANASALAGLLAPGYEMTHEDAEKIVELIISSGAKEKTERTILDESTKALQIVEELSVDQSYKNIFSSLISKLTTRTS